jgi:hypothetical protein
MFNKEIKIKKNNRANPIPTARGNPPICIVDPVISGTVELGQTLTSTTGTWTSTLTVFFSYQWQRNGSDIIGATASTLIVQNADLGTNLRCVVTASNADGIASKASNILTSVASSAPINTSLPVITGTTVSGSILSCSTGTWSNSPTGYSYQWKADGVVIVGAISSTITLAGPQVDRIITCVVTAINGAGSSTATALGVGPVTAGSVPTLSIGGEPFLVWDATDPDSEATELIVGWTYYINYGDWTNSPTEVDWAIYNDADDTVLAEGTSTEQISDAVVFGDELAAITPRLETLARNGTGDAASPAVSVLTVIDDIGATNTIEPDPITAYTRTSASGVTPMTVEITYASNVREGMIRRWNRYSDAAKSTLVSTATHTLTWEDLQSGATIDLDAELGDYDATDWIETVIEVTSPAAIFHRFTYSDALSPTDATIPMVWSTTDKSGGMTLSGGNLVITQSGASMDAIRANRSVSFDKTYFEVTAGIQYTEIGIADTTPALPAPSYWGSTAFGQVATDHAAGWHGNDNQLYYNDTFTNIGAFTAADVISVAYDRVAEKIWFRKNGGSWLPSGDPAAGTGGHSVPGIDVANARPFVLAGGGSTITTNFGDTAFANTPPTGFVAP